MKVYDIYMMVIGCLVIGGFFALLGILIFVEVKQVNESLLNIAIGGLMSSFVTVVAYFFGSSSGSKMKTELMNKPDKKEFDHYQSMG
jgi:Na+/H+ antiporter NhaC